MRYPSVKTIREGLGISQQRAIAIRAVMQDTDYDLDSRMESINDLLGTCGVEYIQEGRGDNSPAITYCNTGDTYCATVMLINGRFIVGCWGDVVESGDYD